MEKRRVCYIPHKEVLQETLLTTKQRLVFDAYSHAPGCEALYDCRETGPNFNSDLQGVLIRFRRRPTALIATLRRRF